MDFGLDKFQVLKGEGRCVWRQAAKNFDVLSTKGFYLLMSVRGVCMLFVYG